MQKAKSIILLIIALCLPVEKCFSIDQFISRDYYSFLSKDRLDYVRPPIIYSGKNKVTWKNLVWNKVTLPDSDIYYYDRIKSIVPLSIDLVEEHDKISAALFNYDIHKYYNEWKEEYFKINGKVYPEYKLPERPKDKKNPILLYGSHQVFEQTNTTYGLIPEGTGGYTEFLKGRVVLPYTGSNKDFVHVIRHEVTHAHTLQKLYQMVKDYDLSGWDVRPPLWMLEGIAEWGSISQYLFNTQTGKYDLDEETKMYLRDATVNNLAPHLKDLDDRPSFLTTYKLSQSVVTYICNKYGKEKFFSIFDNWFRTEPKRSNTSKSYFKITGKTGLDLLNPGISMYSDKPFVIFDGIVFDLYKDTNTGNYSIIRDSENVCTINNIPVNDIIKMSENIKIEDEWFMLYPAGNRKFRLFNRKNGWVDRWNKKNATSIVRSAKKNLLRQEYRLSMNALFKLSLGDDLNTVNSGWHNFIKELYYPGFADKEKLNEANKLTNEPYSVSPVASIDGRFILYKSYKREYYYNINLYDTKTKISTKIAHDNTIDFESIHVLNEGNDIFKTAENKYTIVFSAQKDNSDVIYGVDFQVKKNKVKLGKITLLFDFDDYKIIDISMLKFSDDGKQLIFRGFTEDCKADLYIVDIITGKLTRLTDDYYDDTSCDINGNTVVFTSDRSSAYKNYFYNIYKLSLDEINEDGSYKIQQLTSDRGGYHSTCFTRDGRILFSSYRDGASNIYIINNDGAVQQLTDIYTGVFYPCMENDKLVFCGYNSGRYNVYQLSYSSLNVINNFCVNIATWSRSNSWVFPKHEAKYLPAKYRKSYSMDYFGGGLILNDIEFSANFVGQLYLSDLLGNNIIGLGLLQPSGEELNNIKNLNYVLTYTDLNERFKYGYGIFRIMNNFYLGGINDKFLLSDEFGGYISRAYPLNKSQNISTSLTMKKSSRYDSFSSLANGEVYQPPFLLATWSNSFVHDSTTWGMTSPLEGTLMGVLLDTTFNLSDNGKILNTILLCDYRKYLRLSSDSCIAMRLGAGQSWGDERHYFAMGSGLYMRGYEYATDFRGTKYAIMNLEIRGIVLDAIKFILHNYNDYPVAFGPFEGAIFCDLGYAWSETIPKQLSGSMGLALRFFPVYYPIYIAYETGVVEFWNGGSGTPFNSHFLKFRFSF